MKIIYDEDNVYITEKMVRKSPTIQLLNISPKIIINFDCIANIRHAGKHKLSIYPEEKDKTELCYMM